MTGFDYNKVPYGKNEGKLWKELSDDLLIKSYIYLMSRPDMLSSNCMIKIDKILRERKYKFEGHRWMYVGEHVYECYETDSVEKKEEAFALRGE